MSASLALVALAAALPMALAQTCIPLAGSTVCPAFSSASVTTSLANEYNFLNDVTNLQSFDDGLRDYAQTGYAIRQYQARMGCTNVNLSNSTDVYARYTLTVLCNFLVQSSVGPCGLSQQDSRPLCAKYCGEYAESEADVIASPELCGNYNADALAIIRADYQQCSNPTQALTSDCIDASENEPDECGFQSNLPGLCNFCGGSSANNTDSCCVNAKVESRCVGVHLPTTTSMPPLFTTTVTPTPSSSSNSAPAAVSRSGDHLSGGAIAGIVVGAVVGAALLLAVMILFCLQARKRKQSHAGSILNTPSPSRQPQMSYQDGTSPATVMPGGARVARMSALEGSSSSGRHSSRAGGVGAYRDHHDNAYSASDSGRSHLGNLPKRDGSLSAHSSSDNHSSPKSGSNSDRNFSSPEGVASGQSEQLQFFKDYYSQDEIRPNDTVATLWAYQARANDEFELERGDMLKVVGIWDDGWATGVKIPETAEEWEARRQLQRDSGVSNGGSRQSRPETDNEIKAFPLVCVCLPQHWRKTIEGDSTDTGAGSGGEKPPPSP